MGNPEDEELATVQAALDENVRLGYIEVAGTDAAGQAIYTMTDAGRRRVESMGAQPSGEAAGDE